MAEYRMSSALAKELRVWATEREVRRCRQRGCCEKEEDGGIVEARKAEKEEEEKEIDEAEEAKGKEQRGLIEKEKSLDAERRNDFFTMVSCVLQEMRQQQRCRHFTLVSTSLEQTSPYCNSFGRVYSHFFCGSYQRDLNPSVPSHLNARGDVHVPRVNGSCYQQINPLSPFLTIYADTTSDHGPDFLSREKTHLITDAVRTQTTSITLTRLLCLVLTLLMTYGMRSLFQLNKLSSWSSCLIEWMAAKACGNTGRVEASHYYDKHAHFVDSFNDADKTLCSDPLGRIAAISTFCAVVALIILAFLIRTGSLNLLCSPHCNSWRFAFFPLPMFTLLCGLFHMVGVQVDMVSCALLAVNASVIVLFLATESELQQARVSAFFPFYQLQLLFQCAFAAAFAVTVVPPFCLVLLALFFMISTCFVRNDITNTHRIATKEEYLHLPIIQFNLGSFPLSKRGVRMELGELCVECILFAFAASFVQFSAHSVLIILFLSVVSSISVQHYTGRTNIVWTVSILLVVSTLVPIPGVCSFPGCKASPFGFPAV